MHIELQNLIDKATSENDFFKLAKIIKELRDRWEFPLSQLARKINKHPSYISSIVRVNLLPEIVKDGYYAKQISESHLLVLARLNNPEDMREAYEEILKNNLSLEKTHMLIRKFLYNVEDVGDKPNIDKLNSISKKLQVALGAKVQIYQSRVTGKIVIEQRGDVAQTTKMIEDLAKKLLAVTE